MDATELNLNDTIDSKHITSKSFIAGLKAAKTSKIDLRINSEGGDLLDGLAIYNAIKAHEGQITAHIGLAASIASVIACAAGKVCIAKNGYIMIHNGSTRGEGDHNALRREADVLDKFCNTLAQAYADKSAKTGKNKTAEDFRKAMDKETWFNADEAMAWGLVDEIERDGDEGRMAASAMLAVATYEHAPPALRRFAAKLARAERGTGKETAMADKLVCKDGKWYLGDAEVDVTDCMNAARATAQAPAKPEAPKEDEEVKTKARAEAIALGAKQEREYRAMFSTVVASAKLDATASADFEKQFYGRSETDLKFLASHAIGQRAQPVGEGAPGNGEGEALTAEAKSEKAIEASATKRFSAEPELRRLFGVAPSADADAPEYSAGLKRYVARERMWAKDQLKHGTSVQSAK